MKRARCLALFKELGLLQDGLPILRREPMVAILTTKNRLFSLDHLLDTAFQMRLVTSKPDHIHFSGQGKATPPWPLQTFHLSRLELRAS